MAAFTTALLAISTIASIDQGAKAARAQKSQQAEQQKIANLQTARNRRSQIRQARVAQASSSFQSQAQGMEGSSVLGAQAGIQSQLNANLGFMNQTGQAAEQSSIFAQQAADASSRSQMYGQAANLFQSAGDWDWGTKPTTPTPQVSGSRNHRTIG